MATKLKSWINENKVIVFVLSILFACVCGMLTMIFSGRNRYENDWMVHVNYQLNLAGQCFFGMFCLIFIAVVIKYRSILKEENLLRLNTKIRFDKINFELCVCVLIIGVFVGADQLESGGNYIMGRYCPSISLYVLVWAVFSLSIFCGIMLTDIFLIYRRYRLGMIKETSLILNRICLYRERTDIEKRMWNRRRTSLYITLISMVLATIFLIAGAVNGNETGVIAEIFIIIMAVVFIVNFCSLKKNREMNCLISHIDALSKGDNINDEELLSENSLLYDSDKKLRNIEAAVREMARKQLSAERLKMDLITNVSHDLKTPLTSMVAYTDLLKKEKLSPEAIDYVEAISRKQQQLKEMIQSVFELSKSTSGSEELKIETLDMKILVEQMLADYQEQIENSDFNVKLQVAGENFLFNADNGKMYRVIQNLLENALKYSMKGTRIYINIDETDNNRVQLSIKNISSYEIDFEPEEMLERFARADKARASKGHGLGLAIVNSYILNMNGDFKLSVDGDLFKAVIEFAKVDKS